MLLFIIRDTLCINHPYDERRKITESNDGISRWKIWQSPSPIITVLQMKYGEAGHGSQENAEIRYAGGRHLYGRIYLAENVGILYMRKPRNVCVPNDDFNE